MTWIAKKPVFAGALLIWTLGAVLHFSAPALAKEKKAEGKTYVIDPSHSSVTFKIRHLVAKTQGQFNKFSGTIYYDSHKPKNSWVKATIDVKSIDTGVKKRDEHLLRDPKFFHAQKYPFLEFETVKMVKAKKNKGELVGKLTMHGITKSVILDIQLNGITMDPYREGREKIGFTATTILNRHDFDIVWNDSDKAGNLVLGDQVEIIFEIEAHTPQ